MEVINSDEELQRFVASLDASVFAGTITDKQRLISLLELANAHAKDILRQTEEMGTILEANAQAAAKAEIEKLSEIKPSTDCVEFMKSLERGEHLDTTRLPLHV